MIDGAFPVYVCVLCRDVLREQVLPWLGQVTGIQLTTQIDITCSKYEFTGKPTN